MKYTFAFISIIILFSCKKYSLEKRESITGKWRMVEYCFSPGDASCPIQKIDKNKGQMVHFQADGILIVENALNKISALKCGGEWKNVDETKFEVIFNCQSHLSKNLVYYKIQPDGRLNIYGSCDEECRYTFEPIN